MIRIKDRGQLIENIIDATLSDGPQAIKRFRARLKIDEAEYACEQLASQGLFLQPYDFSSTIGVWDAQNENGGQYKFAALKESISFQAQKHDLDYKTVEGFSQLLEFITPKNLNDEPLNKHGTSAKGLISMGFKNRVIEAIIELVDNDPDFIDIKKEGLKPYDFPVAGQNSWKNKSGKPTNIAREVTKMLLKALGEFTTVEGFKSNMYKLTQETFDTYPINTWGTTLNGMIAEAYDRSPGAAVIDLVAHDPDFKKIKMEGLNIFDFSGTMNIWNDKSGNLTKYSLIATKQLLSKLSRENGIDYLSVEGFKKLLGILDKNTFEQTPINTWGTTLEGLRTNITGGYTRLVLDLANTDPDFSEIKKAGLKSYDISGGPYTWFDKGHNPKPEAREAIKLTIKAISEKTQIDYLTSFYELLPHLTFPAMAHTPFNVWGTTAYGVMDAYGSRPSAAIIDLLEHDSEFSHIDRAKLKFNISPFREKGRI